MTLFYYGTFATFAGLGAQLALLGNHTFAGIEGAPSAVALAWLGPVIGALSRVGAGQVSDKIRGGRVTTIMAICNIIGLLALWWYKPTSVAGCWIWLIIMFWIFFWTGVGNASTTEQWQFSSRRFRAEPLLAGLLLSVLTVLSRSECCLPNAEPA